MVNLCFLIKKIEYVYVIYDRKKEIMINILKIVKMFIYRNNF